MTYLQRLEAWYQEERASGRLQDLKFFPVEEVGTPDRVEALAKAIYEVVTGQVETEVLDLKGL